MFSRLFGIAVVACTLTACATRHHDARHAEIFSAEASQAVPENTAAPFVRTAAVSSRLQCSQLTEQQASDALELHTYGGLPSDNDVYVRRAYVTEYDEEHRVPRWAAWFAEPDYRWTPTRKFEWKSFRRDPDVPNPVVTTDYNGLFASTDNFARGHIVPYFIAGGDRDGDGQYAVGDDGLTLDDIYDACTVYEVNYMSNIAPQYHEAFNGFGGQGESDGLWYQLETRIRHLVDDGYIFHIFAGTVFGDDVQFVGPDGDIGVPDMYYKIVITHDGAVPFLFQHRTSINGHGCALDSYLSECITTVKVIEELTGLDFFSGFVRADERLFENSDGRQIWKKLIQSPTS